MSLSEPSAAVAIVRARAVQESILLIRRSERKEDSWSGHWSFPGGRRDPEDFDLLHTALRELEEECGIQLSREHMEAELAPVLARRKTGPFILVTPFVVGVERELPTVLDHQEAVEAVWVPKAQWCDPMRHTLRTIPGLPATWLFPAIDLPGMPVWGFTYRLAADWLGLLPKTSPIEQVGFEQADLVLEFLLSQGLKLKHGWTERMAQPEATEPQQVKVAAVEGAIPEAQVVEHFTKPCDYFPSLNLLAIQPDSIRMVGLAFEEYLISCASE